MLPAAAAAIPFTQLPRCGWPIISWPAAACRFTIQDTKLYMLQTRNGKRTGPAALKVAVDMEKEVSSTPAGSPAGSSARGLLVCQPVLHSCRPSSHAPPP